MSTAINLNELMKLYEGEDVEITLIIPSSPLIVDASEPSEPPTGKETTMENNTINQNELTDKKDEITILMIRAGERPEEMTIENTLEAKQKLVGGYIEMYYLPTDDDAVIICNEEGKINGLPLNRGIFDEKKRLVEIIAGDFFLCNAPRDSEDFTSLSPKQIEKFSEQFKYPEQFIRLNQGIVAVPIKDKHRDYER